jgi:hypothetical protein
MGVMKSGLRGLRDVPENKIPNALRLTPNAIYPKWVCQLGMCAELSMSLLTKGRSFVNNEATRGGSHNRRLATLTGPAVSIP